MDDSRIARFRAVSEFTPPEEAAQIIFPGDQIAQREYVLFCRSRGWL